MSPAPSAGWKRSTGRSDSLRVGLGCGRCEPAGSGVRLVRLASANEPATTARTTTTADQAIHDVRQLPEVVDRHGWLHSSVADSTRGGAGGLRAGSTRSLASAFAAWLFTVPDEQPSSCAVSTSLRSSR